MRRAHLAVQAVIVLAMVAFVSWPQFRPVRTQSVWRYAPASVLQARTSDAARFAGEGATGGRRPAIGLDRDTFTTADGTANALAGGGFSYTPISVAALGATSNALLGFVRTSLNVPIPYALVVLRNVRTGQVLARVRANERGQFSFLDVDPTEYVVELIGQDGLIVAASPLVRMVQGGVQRIEVRVAAAATAVAASFGNNLAPALQDATLVAATTGVTRTTTMLTTQESPR